MLLSRWVLVSHPKSDHLSVSSLINLSNSALLKVSFASLQADVISSFECLKFLQSAGSHLSYLAMSTTATSATGTAPAPARIQDGAQSERQVEPPKSVAEAMRKLWSPKLLAFAIGW